MTWFFVALAGPFLWALCNFIDKLLVSHVTPKEHPVGVLTLYSSLFSLLILAVLICFFPISFNISFSAAAFLIIAGILEITAIVSYLLALDKEETSVVVPFFQLIPVFTFVIGITFLSETVTIVQIAAGAVTILGGLALALEFTEDHPVKLKLPVLFLMVSSSFLYALYYALFKYTAPETGFWTAVFWQHLGIAFFGILLFLGIPRYRKSFTHSLRSFGVKILSLNVANEVLYTAGIIIFNFALLLAPIALVGTVYAYQPVFVFVLGILFTIFIPNVVTEKISPKHLLHKGLTIGIIVLGSLFLTL